MCLEAYFIGITSKLKWCPGADLNHRHEDFQSTALPLSYPGTGEERLRGWGLSRRPLWDCPADSDDFLSKMQENEKCSILGILLGGMHDLKRVG